jgi:hypothetical protein
MPSFNWDRDSLSRYSPFTGAVRGVVFTIVGYNRLTNYQPIRWHLIGMGGRGRLYGAAFSADPPAGWPTPRLLTYKWPLPNDTRLYRHDNPIWGASCAALGIL